MSFDDDERGIESGQPRELYEIGWGGTAFSSGGGGFSGFSGGSPGSSNAKTVYYLASGDRDVVYNGHTFVATPSARTALQLNPLTGEFSLTLTLPASHALTRRWMAVGGTPPQQVGVIGRRKQLASGDVQLFLDGVIASAGFDGGLAKFSIQDRTKLALERVLPTVTVDSVCANVLYDSWCQVTGFRVVTTANVVDGRQVTVADMGGNPDNWAQNGLLVHVPSGEPMTIESQIGTIVTMQNPIAELKSGDAIWVYAGCDHSAQTCASKFSNILNFSGLPLRPTKNPFVSVGLGVEENR